MDTTNNAFNSLEPIPLIYGLSTVGISVVLFHVVNKYLISTGLKKSSLKIVCEHSRKEWQRQNLTISWIHAFIVAVWDLLMYVYVAFNLACVRRTYKYVCYYNAFKMYVLVCVKVAACTTNVFIDCFQMVLLRRRLRTRFDCFSQYVYIFYGGI